MTSFIHSFFNYHVASAGGTPVFCGCDFHQKHWNQPRCQSHVVAKYYTTNYQNLILATLLIIYIIHIINQSSPPITSGELRGFAKNSMRAPKIFKMPFAIKAFRRPRRSANGLKDGKKGEMIKLLHFPAI